MRKTHNCGELRASDVGKPVTLMGWVHRRRTHGGLVFVDLRDRWGLTQLVFNPSVDAEAHDVAEQCRLEYVIAASGTVAHRPEGTTNPGPGDRRDRARGRPCRGPQRREDAAIRHQPGRPTSTRRSAFAIGISTSAASGCATTSSYGIGRSSLSATGSTREASSKSRRQYSSRRPQEAPGSSSCPAGSTPATSTRFRSRRSSTSSSAWSPASSATSRSPAASATRTSARSARPEFTQLDVEMSFVDEEDILQLTEGLMIDLVEALGVKQLAARPFPRLDLRRGDGPLRVRQARPALRARADRPVGPAPSERVPASSRAFWPTAARSRASALLASAATLARSSTS